VAERLGKGLQKIHRARMTGPNARSAPKGWEAVVANPAETHAEEMERCVVALALTRDLRRR
jgi:hypothetical protein